jgi:hypothetical protein
MIGRKDTYAQVLVGTVLAAVAGSCRSRAGAGADAVWDERYRCIVVILELRIRRGNVRNWTRTEMGRRAGGGGGYGGDGIPSQSGGPLCSGRWRFVHSGLRARCCIGTYSSSDWQFAGTRQGASRRGMRVSDGTLWARGLVTEKIEYKET